MEAGHTAVGVGLPRPHEHRPHAAVRHLLQPRPEVAALQRVQLHPGLRRRAGDELLSGGGGQLVVMEMDT